jgi:CDP-glucose 4,6-dehydratase
VKPDPALWADQRVLLTGHTGFKGAWLALWLTQLGARVWGYSLGPDTQPNLHALIGETKGLTSIYGDIRDRQAMARAVEACDPTIVIHMAAQALVRRGYRSPIETFETNVMGTAILLDALRDRAALRAVLVVTTDKVYRNLEEQKAFREDDPLGGHDPYSASKAACEIATSSWANSFFKGPGAAAIFTARAGNVIGGGDWSEDRLAPDIWKAIVAQDEVILRYPNAVRPWQHVLEPLAGYLRYVEQAMDGPAPEALNFGPDPGDVRTVAELTEALIAALHAKTSWRQAPDPAFAEAQHLSLDPGLAGASIGWRPLLDSGEAIRWTAEWYGRCAKGESARDICLEQIQRYQELN